MVRRTYGVVVSVKTQWWLKVNKPMRVHAPDEAWFPHIVKVQYSVCGREYHKRKWLGAGIPAPFVGERMLVEYHENRPRRSKVL